MGSCAQGKNTITQKKYSISSKKTSSSSDQLPELMRLEIACIEFEHKLKMELDQVQKTFESNQKTITHIIEKGQKAAASRIQGSSLKLLNSMHQIKIFEILLECCNGIEDETHNLTNNYVTDQTKMYICNIIWSANNLKNIICLQKFKASLEAFVDFSKGELHYLIDPELRGLFSKLSEE